MVFWRLLEIKEGETAEDLLTLLKADFKEDRIEDYMKKWLTGYGADGASVMMGEQGGLGRKLEDWTNRPLVKVHCLAHRINLVIRRSFDKNDKLKFMFNLESHIKEVYAFYFVGGHKRKNDLIGFLDGVKIHLTSIFEVRWVASEKKAVDNLIKYYKPIVRHLHKITEDYNFNEKTRSKAKGLLKTMYDKNFYMILHFLADILAILEETSLAFQKRYGLLIQQADNLAELVKKLELATANFNSNVLEALSSTLCGQQPCESMAKYDKHDYIHFPDLDSNIFRLVTNRNSAYPKLSTVQYEMTKALLENVKKYFPEGRLSMYSALDPKTWPAREADVSYFRVEDIHQLYDLVKPVGGGATKQDVTREWKAMVTAIIADEEFCKYKKNLLSFWKHYLESSLVPNAMSDLVIKILSVPVGSADAERAFSTFFHIRDKRRSRLDPKHLEAYMTLRLNGPRDLAAFSAEKYTKSWFDKGGLLTDSPEQSEEEPGRKQEKNGKQQQKLKKAEPKNAEGESTGKDNAYMDGSKYF